MKKQFWLGLVFIGVFGLALQAFGEQSTIYPYTSPLQTNKNVAGKNNFNSVRDDANTDIQAMRNAQQTMNTEIYTSLGQKADASAFASQAAFTAAWGWTPGGVSAWSDVQALISGTGDYIKYDGTRGTPAGSTYTAGTGIDGSMSIDAGTTISDITTDIFFGSRPTGLAYDIGAHEFGSIYSTTCNNGVCKMETRQELTVEAVVKRAVLLLFCCQHRFAFQLASQ